MAANIPKPGAVQAAPKVEADEIQEVVKPASKKIAVEAIEKGWYDNTRKNPGDKFFIENEKSFSKNWMKKI